MTATVASSLDQSLQFSRKAAGQDSSGHANGAYANTAIYACNVAKPSATKLALYAGIIGTQEAMTLRFAQASDIREGDRVAYNSELWQVQNVLNAESYSFCNNALITIIS